MALSNPVKRAISGFLAAALAAVGGAAALDRGEPIYAYLLFAAAALGAILATMFSYEAWEQGGE